MNRALLLGSGLLVLGTIAMTAVFRTLVVVRLHNIDTSIAVLEARLEPVSPTDVLCGVSEQIQLLAQTMQSHCQTVHDVSLAPMPFPARCLHSPSPAPDAEPSGRVR